MPIREAIALLDRFDAQGARELLLGLLGELPATVPDPCPDCAGTGWRARYMEGWGWHRDECELCANPAGLPQPAIAGV